MKTFETILEESLAWHDDHPWRSRCRDLRFKIRTHWIFHPRARFMRLFQRAQRGWSEADAWNLDTYLADVLSQALRYLADNSIGYPGYDEWEDPKKWEADVREMASFFERLNKFDVDLLYPSEAEMSAAFVKLGKMFPHLWW